MNIATGGGTLVHEIVHPFMAANFPDCPAWFNEGLGSLYEQCGEEDGQIHGYTNWRLAGLQEAIRKKRVPSFKTLCSTTDDGVLRRRTAARTTPRPGTCATTCRSKGLLQKFYRRFHANAAKRPDRLRDAQDDPRPRRHGTTFQKEWEAYVLKLTVPVGLQFGLVHLSKTRVRPSPQLSVQASHQHRRLQLHVASAGPAFSDDVYVASEHGIEEISHSPKQRR